MEHSLQAISFLSGRGVTSSIVQHRPLLAQPLQAALYLHNGQVILITILIGIMYTAMSEQRAGFTVRHSQQKVEEFRRCSILL
jgi:hypothetical protein